MYLDSWTELETYKELNFVSLRNGSTTALYIFYLLRYLDAKGNGYVNYNDFLQFLDREGIKREQIYTAFKNPNHATFFNSYEVRVKGVVHKMLRYNSLEKVCRDLDIFPGSSVYIALPNIRTIKKFNAYIYSTLFRVKNNNTTQVLSRQNIKDITGLSIPTQITYEKIAGVEVTPTISCYVVPDTMQHLPMEQIVQSLPCADIYHTVSGNRISWQRANKYRSPDVRVYKGKSHRVNRKIRSTDERVVSQDQGKRANSSVKYYQDITTTMFTDTRSSYINAFFSVPVHYGKQAQMYRYNLFAPTTDPAEAVPGAYLNQNKFVVIGEVHKFETIELVG